MFCFVTQGPQNRSAVRKRTAARHLLTPVLVNHSISFVEIERVFSMLQRKRFARFTSYNVSKSHVT